MRPKADHKGVLLTDWRDTESDDIVMAELLDGQRVRFSAVRKGDVFRFVDPDGVYVDDTNEPADTAYYRAAEDPRKADGTECIQDFGWCLPVEPIENPKKVLS